MELKIMQVKYEKEVYGLHLLKRGCSCKIPGDQVGTAGDERSKTFEAPSLEEKGAADELAKTLAENFEESHYTQ